MRSAPGAARAPIGGRAAARPIFNDGFSHIRPDGRDQTYRRRRGVGRCEAKREAMPAPSTEARGSESERGGYVAMEMFMLRANEYTDEDLLKVLDRPF